MKRKLLYVVMCVVTGLLLDYDKDFALVKSGPVGIFAVLLLGAIGLGAGMVEDRMTKSLDAGRSANPPPPSSVAVPRVLLVILTPSVVVIAAHLLTSWVAGS